MTAKPLTKTLLLTIALPDFYAEDLDEEAEMYDGDLMNALYDVAGFISMTGRFVNLSGDKEGNDLHSSRAVVIGASVVDRKPEHDEPEDERLTDELKKETP